ncbi:MAG: transglutaminase family protein [Pseudomonadota bacterium]
MRYSVRHVTELVYAAPVQQAHFNVRLLPWEWDGHRLLETRLGVLPSPDDRADYLGPYCVRTTQLAFAEPLERLKIVSEFAVEVEAPQPSSLGPALDQVRAESLAQRDLSEFSPAPYLFPSRLADDDPAIAGWAQPFLPDQADIVTAAQALTSAIHSEFSYTPGATTSTTPPAQAFALRAGVCQDFAHVMIIALRSQGIPAAYVSGYLRTEPPPGKPRLVGADAMHAWVNVWCGQELGWVGFDPTNNCRVEDDHIFIGMGRDYADVAPIDGTFIGSAPQTMTTSVDVLPQTENASIST